MWARVPHSVRRSPYDAEIARLAIPALGALAADPLVSLVDTAFVGRLGPEPLGALGVDTAAFSFAFVLFNFLAYGTTPLVASALGRGDREAAGRVVVQALTLAAVFGLAALVVLEALAVPILRLLQAGDAILEPAVRYLRIRALAAPALLVVTVGHGAFRGYLDTRTPLKVTLGLNAVNLVLDPLLIFGAGLGLDGAAIATAVAQWVGAGWFLALLLRRRQRLGIHFQLPRIPELAPLLRVGWELVVRTLALLVAFTLATAMAARIGTETVAAHQVVGQLWLFLALAVDALAIAAQATVARYLGAGHVTAARAAADRLLAWGIAAGVALGVLLLLLRGILPGLFTADPAVRALVAGVVPLLAAMQPLGAAVFVWDGIFMGAARFRFLAGSSLAAALASGAFLLAVPEAGWGLAGVWWGIVLLLVGRGLPQALAYRTGRVPGSSSG